MTRLIRWLSAGVTSALLACGEGPVAPDTGTLEVTIAAQGDALDPDGFALSLDARPAQWLGPNASLTLADLPSGNHTLSLSSLAPNCSLITPNPLTAVVPAGGTVQVTFEVVCSAPGAVEVSIATTGQELDPDGYTVSVDGGVGLAVPLDGQVAISDLLAGDHRVWLSGLAPNCAVAGPNPLTITVTAGGTHAARFDVTCPAWPRLQVTTVTTGSAPDADGFRLAVENEPSQPLGSNATVTLTLAPGGHTLTLSGVAPNCVVIGSNRHTVTLAPGETAEMTFEVSCTVLGQIVVTTTTSGTFSDPNGYTVWLDGGQSQHIGIRDEVTFHAAAGVHSVQLIGVAPGCGFLLVNPKDVTVAAGATARVGFNVFCINF
jgi:hypothetical protein